MIRAVLDTNLWISYLISSRLIDLDPLFYEKDLVLLFSEELLSEFVEVSARPRFSQYFQPEDVSTLLNLFDQFGELVSVETEVSICRDAKDNFLLSLSHDGQADYLVTGDGDLLDIAQFGRTRILKYTGFLKSLRHARS